MTEDIIDALCDALRLRLPAVLDTIWAEHADADGERGDAVPLVYPQVIVHGLRATAPGELPAILVWDAETEVEDAGGTGGAGGGWDEMVHTLVIMAIIGSDEEQTLERLYARYKRAIWRVIKENPTVPDAIGGTYLLQAQRAGRESRASGVRVFSPNTRSAVWEVTVRDLESF